MASPEPEVGDDVGKVVPRGDAVDCFRCTQLYVRIDEILAQLRKVDMATGRGVGRVGVIGCQNIPPQRRSSAKL